VIAAHVVLMLCVVAPIAESDCPTRGDTRALSTRYANLVLIDRRVSNARPNSVGSFAW